MVAGGAWFAWPAPLLPRLLAPDSPVSMSREQASWMVACVEVGSTFSVYSTALIADRFGRKFCILINTPAFLLSLVLFVYVKTFPALCAARFIVGMMSTMAYTILPSYLGEVASADVRGAVTSMFHIAWGIGCLIPYCVGPYLSYDNFTYFTFSLTVISVLCFAWQPESPYYYALRGNIEESAKSLMILRDSVEPEEVQYELEEILEEVRKGLEKKTSLRDVVASAEDRRAFLLLIIVGSVAFLSGQNAILSYTTDTFSQLPNSLISPDNVTMGIGLVALVGSVFSVFTSDKFGRRFLLLFSATGCMLSLFVTSAFFYINSYTSVDMSPYSWIPPLALMTYNLFVTAGMHPVYVTYSSELFPTRTRSLTSSLSNLNLTFCSFLTLKFYVSLAAAMGTYFPFLVFGLNCLIGICVFYLMMPETKGKTFLEIRKMLKNKTLK